jgi:hypothetical protein
MTQGKPTTPPCRGMAQDNHTPATKNFTPRTTGVQSNHKPETQQAPSAPPPSPKKK